MFTIQPSPIRVVPVVGLLVVAACGGEAPPTDPGEEVTPVPTITATQPAAAAPTQRLEVRVLGTGFDATADAVWERAGMPEPGIVVHSTRYVSPTEVVANVSVAPGVTLALYDVGVKITRKRGSGIEKGVLKEGFLIGTPLRFSGAFTSAPQPVREVCSASLSCQHSEMDYVTTIDFPRTHAAGMDECAFWNNAATVGEDALFARLRWAQPVSGTGYAHWDKQALDDGRAAYHLMFQSMANETTVDWQWALTGLGAAAMSGVRLDDTTYRFTGGEFQLRKGPWQRYVGGPSTALVMTCPNLDTIVVTYPAGVAQQVVIP